MSRKLIAGNWKMNLNGAEAEALAGAIAAGSADAPADIAVCPPFVYLPTVAQALAGSAVALGAQNMYSQEGGAFTGEISPAMLLDVGCRYVILGHSERRHVMGETDAQVNAKVHLALAKGLTPIVCVGETLQEREDGRTTDVVGAQFRDSLQGLTAEQAATIVIAYEPVWAIGTGKVASTEQAEEVHADLRKMLINGYNADVAKAVRIQYGGSVKPDNAAALLSQPNIDGALVGGASLKAADFLAIVQASA